MSNTSWFLEVNLNSLIDVLLRDIVKWINIDDLVLPDFRDVIKLPSADHFHLLNGYAWNLKDISKAGDTKIIYNSMSVALKTGICLHKLNFTFDYDTDLQGYAMNGKLIGNIDELQICFKVSLKNCMLVLESYTVSIGHIELDMKTNSIRGWFTSINLSWFIKITIKSLIEQKVRDFLQKVIVNVNNSTAEYRSQLFQTDFLRNWIKSKLSDLMVINFVDSEINEN